MSISATTSGLATLGGSTPHRVSQLSALGGVIHYECLMQIRRVSFWVLFALVGALAVATVNVNIIPQKTNLPQNITHHNITINLMAGAGELLWVGAGLLLAGRVRRDRTTKMDELLQTTPATVGTRFFGKYIGSLLATLVPMALVFLICIATIAVRWHELSFVPLALVVIALEAIPATLFIAAFSVACSAFLWPPLFQFLFIGYYLWESLPPGGPLPTLDGTILSPSMRLVEAGILHFAPFRTTDYPYYPPATVWDGLANIATLLVVGALALLVTERWLTWRAKHQ